MNIFIHRRDIRLNDNTTLNKMLEELEGPTISIFIFTPEQITSNPYFSNNLVQFLCFSLLELQKEYKKYNSDLYFFYGHYISILEELNKEVHIKNIGFNLDYSPYSKKRDLEIKEWCNKYKINCIQDEDMLLVNIINNKNYPNITPYKVFTPFLKYQKNNFKVSAVNNNYNNFKNLLNCKETKIKFKFKFLINSKKMKSFFKMNNNLAVKPGRIEGIKHLLELKNKKDYNSLRNTLIYKTSYLSAYINLGLVSIREIYWKAIQIFGSDDAFVNELYWRDFYYNILFHFPHIVGKSFNSKYDTIKWDNDEKLFEKWCNGLTGFPIVDASMRQLNTTGYMHNRGRMIVSSFLTKDLFIDWKWGEKYFATQLIDYNISANNGGWQWSSGSGTDSQPYFRIFNPITQIEKFDSECLYIKKWVPELESLTPKEIIQWNDNYSKFTHINYPSPIVNHKERYKYTISNYKKYL
jgi:deoxyribodipyrimidine photo-lyase